MIKSSLTAVCSEMSYSHVAICYTPCHSAIIGKISAKKEKRWSDNMPAWDVSLFSLSLSPSSLSLYLDPGDEQGKVCCRKKHLLETHLKKHWMLSSVGYTQQEKHFISFFFQVVTIGALYRQKGVVCKLQTVFTMCMQIQLTRWLNNPTVLCENIWHEMYIDLYRPGGLLRHMLLFKCQWRFTSKQKSVFLLWTRSHHRRHLQHNTWKFSYKC